MEVTNLHVEIDGAECRVLRGDEGEAPLLIIGPLVLGASTRHTAEMFAAAVATWAVAFGYRPADNPDARALDELVSAIDDSSAVSDVLHNAAPYDSKEHRVRHALQAAKEALSA